MRKLLFILALFQSCSMRPAFAQLTAPPPDTVYTITRSEVIGLTNGIRRLQAEEFQFFLMRDSLLPLYRFQIMDYSRLIAQKNTIILNDSVRIVYAMQNDSLYQHALEKANSRSFWENPFFLIGIGLIAGVALRSKF